MLAVGLLRALTACVFMSGGGTATDDLDPVIQHTVQPRLVCSPPHHIHHLRTCASYHLQYSVVFSRSVWQDNLRNLRPDKSQL